MQRWKKLLFAALLLGFAASSVLAAIEALHHSDIIMIAQFPGFVVAWEIAYGGGDLEVMTVMVLVNATCYAAVFAGLFLLAGTVTDIRRKERVHD